MTGFIGASAAIGDAVVLVSLWAVVLCGRAPRAARVPLGLIAFAGAWTLCFFLMKSHSPRWTWFACGAAVVISVLMLVVAAQTSLPHDGGGGGNDDDGGGGLEPRPPDRPIDGGGPSEPEWWPEFERGLARYTAERERSERETLVGR
jgi:amino acid transporter